MKKRIILLISAVIFLGFNTLNANASGNRTVTDLNGVKIQVPDDPKSIACFYRPAYEKLIMFGKASRISIIPYEASKWVYKFYPELKGIQTHSYKPVPDVETLIKLKVDLLICPGKYINMRAATDAGIVSVSPYTDNIKPSNINEFVAMFEKEVCFIGEILGSDTRTRSEIYCRYLDDIVAKINKITSGIPEADKPKVYYGKSSDFYSTQGSTSGIRWYTELAGGIYVARTIPTYSATINKEQIISWDPDIILLGIYGLSDVKPGNSEYSMLRAFDSGKVYRIPAGIFFWDLSGCENALLPLFLGKKFHPYLFKNWDMLAEMKKFYSEIYRINITDQDAERMLNCLPPMQEK
jgi:iron complex transport system substrate-binding protein